MTERIGIVAALAGELRPLVQGWRRVRLQDSRQDDRDGGDGHGVFAWEGELGGAGCIAVACGIGRAAAERACALALGSGQLSALVSIGWAGALSCGVSPGTAYPITELVDAATGERFASSSPAGAGLRLITLDHVAQAAEKRKLAATYRAVLVDMEGAAVARVAQSRSLPFYAFKAVSDRYTDDLPDFAGFVDSNGGLRLPKLVAFLGFRPRYWPGLARMRKNTKTGALALAASLREMFGE